jgi:hypothetical protein
MFSTFQDEMQHIFVEENFIFVVFFSVKDAEIMKTSFVSSSKNELNDVCSATFNSKKDHEHETLTFSEKIYCILSNGRMQRRSQPDNLVPLCKF